MTKPDLPPDSEAQLRLLLQDLQLAIDSTTRRAAKWRGWKALNQSGPYGDDILPYSERAFSEFEAAYSFDEGDGDTLHHLAVGYHALAWESELSEDFDAVDHAWHQAPFYWRSLQSCGNFWQDLIEKGRSLTGFDPQNPICPYSAGCAQTT